MFISKNSICITLLYIGLWVNCSYVAAQHSLYDPSKQQQLYDTQQNHQYYPYQYAPKSQDYINHQGYNSIVGQKPSSHLDTSSAKAAYPYVSLQDWHHQQQLQQQHTQQHPQLQHPQLQHPQLQHPQLKHPQQQHPLQQQLPQQPHPHYHTNSHHHHHHHQSPPIIHKTSALPSGVSTKYSIPIVNPALYQSWLQNNKHKRQSAVATHNSTALIPLHKATPKPTKGNKSHKKTIIFTSLPSFFYKLFPQFMPFVGVETYHLTVHRYPMLMVTAKK